MRYSIFLKLLNTRQGRSFRASAARYPLSAYPTINQTKILAVGEIVDAIRHSR